MSDIDQPLLDWFAKRGWTAAPFQREVWRRFLRGESGLLHTPTGSGKTLAAFGGPLLQAMQAPAREKGDRSTQLARVVDHAVARARRRHGEDVARVDR